MCTKVHPWVQQLLTVTVESLLGETGIRNIIVPQKEDTYCTYWCQSQKHRHWFALTAYVHAPKYTEERANNKNNKTILNFMIKALLVTLFFSFETVRWNILSVSVLHINCFYFSLILQLFLFQPSIYRLSLFQFSASTVSSAFPTMATIPPARTPSTTTTPPTTWSRPAWEGGRAGTDSFLHRPALRWQGLTVMIRID